MRGTRKGEKVTNGRRGKRKKRKGKRGTNIGKGLKLKKLKRKGLKLKKFEHLTLSSRILSKVEERHFRHFCNVNVTMMKKVLDSYLFLRIIQYIGYNAFLINNIFTLNTSVYALCVSSWPTIVCTSDFPSILMEYGKSIELDSNMILSRKRSKNQKFSREDLMTYKNFLAKFFHKILNSQKLPNLEKLTIGSRIERTINLLGDLMEENETSTPFPNVTTLILRWKTDISRSAGNISAFSKNIPKLFPRLERIDEPPNFVCLSQLPNLVRLKLNFRIIRLGREKDRKNFLKKNVECIPLTINEVKIVDYDTNRFEELYRKISSHLKMYPKLVIQIHYDRRTRQFINQARRAHNPNPVKKFDESCLLSSPTNIKCLKKIVVLEGDISFSSEDIFSISDRMSRIRGLSNFVFSVVIASKKKMPFLHDKKEENSSSKFILNSLKFVKKLLRFENISNISFSIVEFESNTRRRYDITDGLSSRYYPDERVVFCVKTEHQEKRRIHIFSSVGEKLIYGVNVWNQEKNTNKRKGKEFLRYFVYQFHESLYEYDTIRFSLSLFLKPDTKTSYFGCDKDDFVVDTNYLGYFDIMKRLMGEYFCASENVTIRDIGWCHDSFILQYDCTIIMKK